MTERDERKALLLSNPDMLRQKKPFVRGTKIGVLNMLPKEVCINETYTAGAPCMRFIPISQDELKAELDPYSHKVLFDDNVPSITMKVRGRYIEIEYKKMALPIQQMIVDKHVMHLCGNKMSFTLSDKNPTNKQQEDFITFKQYWEMRNQDGMKTKMVKTQKSTGDAGLLYYFDYKGCIKSRLISYDDGYVICSHNDDNGDRLLESVYYKSDNVEYIDSYDDEYLYRYTRKPEDMSSADKCGWVLSAPVKHGFLEIPLVTKRGPVAWNNAQTMIEALEVMYNVFLVIQKRHGWGILYVKGKISDEGKKIAGAIILNDRSIDGNGSAEFKTPPTPQGMLDTMEDMRYRIQEAAGATFLLPKDVKMSGDVSGIAVELTQQLDNETAMQGVIEWQNVADKMTRLFKYGLSKELVNKGINTTAITDFDNININAKFTVWKPRNDTEYNNMLISLRGAGLISAESGIELNTASKPDEKARVAKEAKASTSNAASGSGVIVEEVIENGNAQ
jgi:hypothetical protein